MIYIVKRGDTLYSIAKMYNTTTDQLTQSNGLTKPDQLVIGQSLWIPPTTLYTVVRGDSLYKIANRFGVTIEELTRANNITNPNYIEVGQTITIPSNKNTIEVNGYAIANISENTLNKTLPYLTYLSVFSYQLLPDGNLTPLYEQNIVDSALNSQTTPVMVITNIGKERGFDSNLARQILQNENLQKQLFDNIIVILSDKKYKGVDIDFEYLYPEDKDLYVQFLQRLKTILLPTNTPLSVAVAPKYSDNQQGILYESHDYRRIGEVVDRVIIMTYEWGYIYGEPMAISPLREVERVISYATTRIPSKKILMGMPNYAYSWKIPYRQGSVADTISNTRALEIAIEKGATINFDTRAQSPYFNYIDDDGNNRVIWFDDARSISSRLNLVNKYRLAGVSYWTINNYYNVNWQILSSMFNIVKF